MASETKGQLTVFTCDNCGEDLTIYATRSFRFLGWPLDDGTWHLEIAAMGDAWDVAKQDGWRCFKDEDGDWVHRCPECRGIS